MASDFDSEVMERFVEDVRDVFAATDDPLGQSREVAARTQDLLNEGDWFEEALEFSGGKEYNTFHVSDEFGYPDPGFKVMGFATDGDTKEVKFGHDHGPTWVVYGVYRGEIRQTKFGWDTDDPADPSMVERSSFTQGAGEVTVVMPGELHATNQASDDPLWVIRVESQDLGTVDVPQQRYDLSVAGAGAD